MPMSQRETLDIVGKLMLPTFKAEKGRLDHIDNWYRWDHDQPHQPRHSTKEYKELSARAQTPWLGLVVTSVAQSLYVEGYRRAEDPTDAAPWQWWQVNGLDRRQLAVHRAAIAYGLSYTTVLPGADDFGDPMPVIQGHSPRRMIAMYDEPERDDWPHFALQAEPARINGTLGYALRLYDDTSVYFLQADATGANLTWVESRLHDVNVCPVVRFANMLDLEGRADGEVEPFIPVAGRIDQTVFDRLVVQRFSSWVVRTVAGMAQPDTDEDAIAARLRLKVEDLLVAEDPDTKFGSLPATPLDGFIQAAKADIQTLAAVSQTPAHELLGDMVNLSAEALAAARASLTAKVDERKHTFGESWEQTLRLSSWVMGDTEAARDYSAQVRWKDTEIRSLAQAADALGKMATMLGVPVEVLWEKIPGWTDQDVARAKALADQGGGLEALMRELAGGQTSAPAVDTDDIKERADAMGVLIRAGVAPDSAAGQVGLSGIEFTGAVPTSLRLPQTDASNLEQV